MTTELIVRFVEGRPFESFEIITVDGRAIPLPSPDAPMLERFAAAVTILNDDGTAEMIDTALIVSIRTLGPFRE